MTLKVRINGENKGIATATNFPITFINGVKKRLTKGITFVNGEKRVLWGTVGMLLSEIDLSNLVSGGDLIYTNGTSAFLAFKSSIITFDINNYSAPTKTGAYSWGAYCCSDPIINKDIRYFYTSTEEMVSWSGGIYQPGGAGGRQPSIRPGGGGGGGYWINATIYHTPKVMRQVQINAITGECSVAESVDLGGRYSEIGIAPVSISGAEPALGAKINDGVLWKSNTGSKYYLNKEFKYDGASGGRVLSKGSTDDCTYYRDSDNKVYKNTVSAQTELFNIPGDVNSIYSDDNILCAGKGQISLHDKTTGAEIWSKTGRDYKIIGAIGRRYYALALESSGRLSLIAIVKGNGTIAEEKEITGITADLSKLGVYPFDGTVGNIGYLGFFDTENKHLWIIRGT